MTLLDHPLLSSDDEETAAAGWMASPPARRETIDRGNDEGLVSRGQALEGSQDGSTGNNTGLDANGNTAGERNENLSQAGLSLAGSIATEAPPATRDLAFLGEDQCRVPMSCKQATGGQVLAFCGQEADTCRHRGHRNKQSSSPWIRGTVGYYFVVLSPNSRSRNGRKDMRCYSVAEYLETKAGEEAELEAVGEGFALAGGTDLGSEYGEEYGGKEGIGDVDPPTRSEEEGDTGAAQSGAREKNPPEALPSGRHVVVETVDSDSEGTDRNAPAPPILLNRDVLKSVGMAKLGSNVGKILPTELGREVLWERSLEPVSKMAYPQGTQYKPHRARDERRMCQMPPRGVAKGNR